jgi:hypothetical protein
MKLAVFLLAAVSPAFAFAGDVLTVDGSATTQPSHWTVDQLKHQAGVPTTQISYESRDGSDHHSTCLALLDVLKAAGVPAGLKMDAKADPHTKNRALRLFITAKASDGYAVVFSLAELLPEIGHRAVWVALDEDDQPLADRDVPIKLIVPDDTKPARWVHGVQEVSVDDATTSK